MRNNNEEEHHESETAKSNRGSLFWAFLDGLTTDTKPKDVSDDGLMSWEKDAIKNDHYEPHNFEEEELEEDDYYYEDDK